MPYFGGTYRPRYTTTNYGSTRSSSKPNLNSRGRRHAQLGESVEGRTNTHSDDAFHRRMKALHADEKKPQDSQLHATHVEFHVKENREAHHTSDYELNNLIVRRGQPFQLTVTFDRPLDPKRDRLILQFITGSRPQESKNSLIRVKETKQLTTSSWGMHIDQSSGEKVSLTVMPPADAFVGEYSVYVETRTKKPRSEEEMSFRQKRPEKIYILFNAWCKDDTVYMENDTHRKEYVLNDHGRIWIGTTKKMVGIPWNFGQFEAVSLTAFTRLLEIANLGTSSRGNPISICRIISQMSNFNDRDGGVLCGRWSTEYPENTTKPTEWVGSVGILKKFDQLHQVVRYGQCWVFSGLVTTLLRAIGIPTRSVTNFESAHDSDHSMTIDFHFDFEGKPMDELNDSVWNFHVWNESYFARSDLPPGYGGWQAHDATPQETSDGVFRCGPCPVKAVKNGEVFIPYDTGFVFAEVNGDKVFWDVDITGEMTVSHIDKKSIGKFVSTKAVGTNERDDITKNYKFDEGSAEERKAVELAYKYSSKKDRQIYSKPSSNDVEFDIRTSEHTMMAMIGEDFKCELFIKNNSRERRTIQVAIVGKIAFYTGISSKDLKDLHKEVTLRGGENTSVYLPVNVDEYVGMASDSTFNIFYKANVKETGHIYSNMEKVELCKPLLQIDLKEIPRDIKLSEMFDITFSFVNPLPVPLTNGVLNVECMKMKPNTITKRISKAIGAKEETSVTVTMESVSSGRRVILGCFKSDQICGVRGELEHNII